MKKKIVIASVLKPVDDVRAYWKLSQSIAKTNKYEVNIIGNGGKKRANENNIQFHSHSTNRHNWIKRVLIREAILFRILKSKPEIIIITTHELINAALICKLILRCKVIYDVQENYKLNASTLNPSPFKKLLATFIRWKESLSQSFIDQYWLAERCYENELNFVKDKFVIIENKAFEFPIRNRDFSKPNLLFSGTISDYGGVKKAVTIFEKLNESGCNASLTIIGQVHDSKLYEWLIKQQEIHTRLVLKISTDPIPHESILQAITEANLGVIGYQPNIVNENKIPTKLYEYSRYQLPYLIEKEAKWSEIGRQLGGAITTDFSNIKVSDLLEKLKKSSVLFPARYPTEATWENESLKVIESINNLTKVS